MKILRLRFKNLNSLQGEWEIDFTRSSFSAEGIFAITGPTGAGKSTILDAICLGLFGRTPRLEVISKSSNDIMSRHTGECMAEVEFSTLKGTYRANWYQNRARQRADGALQQPKHTLADCETGAFLTSKLGTTARKVEDVTGLNYTRFTRSVLLAQGSFAAFLQARDDDRSDVLEQLTGTEIYSDISRAVFEQTKAENQKLEQLKESVADLRLLTPEEEELLRQQLLAETSSANLLAKERDALRAGLEWHKAIALLEQELAGIAQAKNAHARDVENFTPSQLMLELAQKALELEAPYTDLKTSRDSLASVQRQLASEKNTLESSEKALERLSEQYTAAQAALLELRKRHQSERLVHIQVRDLDTRLAEQAKNQHHAYGILCRQQQTLKEATQEAERQKQLLAAGYENLFSLYCQRKARASQEFLAEGFWDIQKTGEQLAGLLQEHERLAQRRSALQNETAVSSKNFAAAEAAMQAYRQKLDDARTALQALSQEKEAILAGKGNDGWRNEYERGHSYASSLEQVMALAEQTLEAQAELEGYQEQTAAGQISITRAAKDLQQLNEELSSLRAEKSAAEKDTLALALSGHRSALTAGEPCPLCGALEHPYAEQPYDDSLQHSVNNGADAGGNSHGLAERLRILDNCIQEHEKKLRLHESRQAEAQGSMTALVRQYEQFQKRVAALDDSVRKKSAQLGVACDQVNAAFLAVLQKIFAEQMGKQKTARQVLERIERLGQDVERSSAAVMRLQTEYDQHLTTLKNAELTLAAHEKNLLTLDEQIKNLQTAVDDGIGGLREKLRPLSGHRLLSAPFQATLPVDMPSLFIQELSPSQQVAAAGMSQLFERSWQKTSELTRSQGGLNAITSGAEKCGEYRPEQIFLAEKPVAQDIINLLACLNDTRNSWMALAEQYVNMSHELEAAWPLCKLALDTVEKEQHAVSLKEADYNRLRTEGSQLLAERKNLFGEADVREREERLAHEETLAEQCVSQATSAMHEKQGTIVAMREHIQKLARQLETMSDTLTQREKLFADLLAQHAFNNEEHFVSCCLEARQRKLLEETARRLAARKTELESREREKILVLQEKRLQQPMTAKENEIREQYEAIQEKIQHCHETIGSLREKLDRNHSLQQQKSQRLQAILAQQQEVGKWSTLNELIGSQNGKKFRLFAQGLTFEAVIVEANRVLARLSDRYTLLRDKDNPLELNVCDNDQAGEIRSTRNLSGGESFIVSLALALGLSSMASRKVRLDSLFLDEGFGALDEDTLDVALDVLSSLPDDGKVIGIISHVTSLKERIRKSIQVTPLAGGRSRLEEDDGVRRVE